MNEGFSDEANKLMRKESAIVWKLEVRSCDKKDLSCPYPQPDKSSPSPPITLM
jgi:hypothetical protein